VFLNVGGKPLVVELMNRHLGGSAR